MSWRRQFIVPLTSNMLKQVNDNNASTSASLFTAASLLLQTIKFCQVRDTTRQRVQFATYIVNQYVLRYVLHYTIVGKFPVITEPSSVVTLCTSTVLTFSVQ